MPRIIGALVVVALCVSCGRVTVAPTPPSPSSGSPAIASAGPEPSANPDVQEVTRLARALADKDRPGEVAAITGVEFFKGAQGCGANDRSQQGIAATATVRYVSGPDGYYFFCRGVYGTWDYYGNTYPPYGE